MADTLDTSGDTGPTSDANTNYDTSGRPSTSTGTLGSYLTGLGGLTNSVLGYLSTSNQSAAQKQIAALNATTAANQAKRANILAGVSQRTWLIAGGTLVAVVLLVVLFRRNK